MNSKKPSSHAFLLNLIAHVSTFLNVLCGFLGILATFDKNFELALRFLVLGGVFDILDGKVAKMAPTESDLGIYLDSAADVVTFAILPGFMLLKSEKLLNLFNFQFFDFNIATASVIASFFAICGWIRLIRFAMAPTGLYFEGIPAPAAAVIISTMCVISQDSNWNRILFDSGWFLSIIAIIIAILMITKIPFPSFKGLNNVDKVSLGVGGFIAILYLIFPEILLASLLMITFYFYAVGGSYYLYLERVERKTFHEVIKYIFLLLYPLLLLIASFISLS